MLNIWTLDVTYECLQARPDLIVYFHERLIFATDTKYRNKFSLNVDTNAKENWQMKLKTRLFLLDF